MFYPTTYDNPTTTPNPTTYICIRLHGGVCTAEKRNPNRVETTPNRIFPPQGLKVTKYNIAVPGTVGLSNSPECAEVSKVLEDEPLISADEITNIIFELYNKNIKKRRKYASSLTKGTIFTDTSMRSPPENPPLEPDSENQLIEKEYTVDTTFTNYLHSIEILNGQYKGQNILEKTFFETNILKGIETTPDEWHTFEGEEEDENLTVFKQITLVNLLGALKTLGLQHVYIIDPTCSNGIYLTTARDNRGLTREVNRQKYFPEMRRMTSGEVTGENPNSQKSSCIECDDTTWSSQLYNCCTKTIGFVKSGLGFTGNTHDESVLSQKREREGGGGKKHKTKTKKHYKTKTKKHYKTKTKKHYKTKTKKHYKTKTSY